METRTNPHRHAFRTGDKVKLLTPAGGCYDGASGTVTGKLDAGLAPYPEGQEPDVPRFYAVRTDAPVDIGGGTMSREDVHPSNQVFPASTPLKNYWDSGYRPDEGKEAP